jgi:hypothetical protein
MSGSVLAAAIVPIVMVPVLFLWLAAVFYADTHPVYRTRSAPDAARARLEVAELTEREAAAERERVRSLAEEHADTPSAWEPTSRAALGHGLRPA